MTTHDAAPLGASPSAFGVAPRVRTAAGRIFPVAVWLAFLGAVVGRSGSLASWATPRWDGSHYVSIAREGYKIARCGDIWCGNPWFPGWSYVNDLLAVGLGLRAMGLSLEGIFVGASAAALLALLWLLSRHAAVFLAADTSARGGELGVWACAGLLCQPGSFYLLTHFPYTFVLLTAVLFRILRVAPGRLACPPRRGAWLGALAAFWSSLSYPTALLYALYPLLGFATERRYRQLRGWIELAGWMAVFSAGTLVVCLIFHFQFGMFWLYFTHQAQFPRAPFLVSTVSVVVDLLRNGNENERLTFLWYAFGLAIIGLRLPKIHREPSFWFVLLVLLFYPATGTWICLYRYYLLALPMFVLLGEARCSRWLKGGYLGLGLLLQFALLYPRYVNGELM